MMKLLYAVDYTVNTVLNGALYADGKVTLQGLTEEEVVAKGRKINWINRLGFNPTNDPEQSGLSTIELSTMITGLAAQDPNEVLGVLSKSQGKWLHANHPDFMGAPHAED